MSTNKAKKHNKRHLQYEVEDLENNGKMSEFDKNTHSQAVVMTFNQKFTFAVLATILLFNLISTITEFSYFT